jgi:hypothetical protein
MPDMLDELWRNQRNWPGTAWLSFCAERDRRQCQQTEGRDWSYTGSAAG